MYRPPSLQKIRGLSTGFSALAQHHCLTWINFLCVQEAVHSRADRRPQGNPANHAFCTSPYLGPWNHNVGSFCLCGIWGPSYSTDEDPSKTTSTTAVSLGLRQFIGTRWSPGPVRGAGLEHVPNKEPSRGLPGSASRATKPWYEAAPQYTLSLTSLLPSWQCCPQRVVGLISFPKMGEIYKRPV